MGLGTCSDCASAFVAYAIWRGGVRAGWTVYHGRKPALRGREDCVTVSRGCGVYCLGTVAACDPGSGTRGVFAGRDLASVSRAWSCELPLRCVLCFDVAHQQPRLRFCGCALARGVVTQQLGGRLPRCMLLKHVRVADLSVLPVQQRTVHTLRTNHTLSMLNLPAYRTPAGARFARLRRAACGSEVCLRYPRSVPVGTSCHHSVYTGYWPAWS